MSTTLIDSISTEVWKLATNNIDKVQDTALQATIILIAESLADNPVNG